MEMNALRLDCECSFSICFLSHSSARQTYHQNIFSFLPVYRNVLKNQNGSAVDAAIATLFCEGVSVPQSMGLGGGFIATIFDKGSNSIETVIARERAPLASHEKMFVNVSEVTGILAMAVPGELKGYWSMHQKYGRVAWSKLIKPSIELCRRGHLVSVYLATVLRSYRDVIRNSSLSEVFMNPRTNDVWQAGDRIKRPQLAQTLQIIADEGADALYSINGTLIHALSNEIRELGGIITADDFLNYDVEWKKPVTTKLRNGYSVYSPALPSTGHVLSLILNVMELFPAEDSVQFLHRLIETYKFAFGRRSSLGDVEMDPKFMSEFTDKNVAKMIHDSIWDNQTFNDVKHYGGSFAVQEDHGTAHINVLAENGDAVSVTSSINTM